MTYEELLIDIDLKGYENVLPSVGRKCFNSKYWFVVCDDGDCHLYDKNGREDDIRKVKEIYEDMIPKDIKKIVIPNSVTYIEKWTFYACHRLMSVSIPDSVTSIGYGAFEDCSGLTNMTIPDSVKNIGDWAFYNCYDNLKSLIFKSKSLDQVKSMENYPWKITDKSIIKCI